MKKINYKQPKYVLPLILYPLILGTGYFVIGMFTTEVKSVDKNLMATNYLNSELPEAHIDEELGSKRENMVNAFGDAKDYTAVENAERDSVKGKEEYQTRYNNGEAAAIVRHDAELENLRQLQRKKREIAEGSRGMGKDDFVVPLSEEDRRNARRLRGREGREETEDLLAQTRAQGRGVMGSASASFDDDDEESPRKKGRSKEDAGTVADGEEKAETVVKVMKTESEYFNTVSQNAPCACWMMWRSAVCSSRREPICMLPCPASESSASRERFPVSLSAMRLRPSTSPSMIPMVWKAFMFLPALSARQPRILVAQPCSRACPLTAPARIAVYHSGRSRPYSRPTNVLHRLSARLYARIR